MLGNFANKDGTAVAGENTAATTNSSTTIPDGPLDVLPSDSNKGSGVI